MLPIGELPKASSEWNERQGVSRHCEAMRDGKLALRHSIFNAGKWIPFSEEKLK